MALPIGTFTLETEGQVFQPPALAPGVFTIGRLPNNWLVLPHPNVERYHAELHVEPEGIYLTDLGSSAGTKVGGVSLLAQQPYPLIDDTIVEINPFRLRYHAAQTLTSPGEPATALPLTFDVPVLPISTTPIDLLGVVEPMLTLPVGVSRYLNDLPVIFHSTENEFLGRYLQIYETIWESFEHRQDHIDMYFVPRTCPETMLPWLASWFGLLLDTQLPVARRRTLLTEAMDLYRWRGTRYGLARVIAIYTGLTPEIIESPHQPIITIRVAIPSANARLAEMVEELVKIHKPGHVGYVLEFI
jgi:phage tail-like protein